ncbi:MAG: hypothetical protein VYA30_13535 [Myxococcota bacterium]|nr:hypothetical protein [Myxococcota bacterium]
MLFRTFTLFLGLSLPLYANASEVCVSIDETVDGLSPQERKSSLLIAKGAFGKLKVKVVPAPCENEYKFAAGNLGRALIATVSGPKGTQKRKADSIEELAEVYDQLVRAIWLGGDVDDNSGESITRTNVDTRRQFPGRVKDDRLVSFSLGGAFIQGVDVDEVPIVLGLARSHELDRFALDYGGYTLFTYGDDESSGKDSEGAFRIALHLGGKYFFDPASNYSPYASGALTATYSVTEIDDASYTGGGLGTRLAVGYSIGRASTIRGFVELCADLPFYNQEYSTFNGSGPRPESVGDEVYTAFYGLVLGVSYTTHRYGFIP